MNAALRAAREAARAEDPSALGYLLIYLFEGPVGPRSGWVWWSTILAFVGSERSPESLDRARKWLQGAGVIKAQHGFELGDATTELVVLLVKRDLSPEERFELEVLHAAA